tara:strand:+ start:6701 stop:8725 length:2025 start_codon:yes stop_codon:yes gene_type:complete
MSKVNMLIVDFETRSRVDLLTAGSYLYAQDGSTQVICCSFMFSDPEDEREWLIYGNMPHELCSVVAEHVKNGGLVAAANAAFDQAIWEYVAVGDNDYPEVPEDQWYCILAQCRVNALPASLDKATRALNSDHRKDHKGSALIRQLCIPDKTGQFNRDPRLIEQMGDYCLDDTRAAKDVVNSCRLLSPSEHRDWLLNEQINRRGIRIDRPLAQAATQYATAETVEIGQELAVLTNYEITKHTQNLRIKKWVLARVSDEVEALTVVYKEGVRKNSLAKDIRATILDMADAEEIKVPDAVYNVIMALDEGNKSSVSKFKRMLERADPDTDRVQGAFVYAGASTLRYTSRGLQLHNFKRDCFNVDTTQNYRAMMLSGHKIKDDVMGTLGKLLRPALIPAEGHTFVVGDWSSVENRGLPYLSDSDGGREKLARFVEQDNDPTAPDMYTIAATDAGFDDRQIGKVIELSLGYLGANGAFVSMARNYGVYLPEYEVTRIVKTWRIQNAWAVDFGNELSRAAIAAVKHAGSAFRAGRVEYTFVPELMGGTLLCCICDEIWISYPQARVQTVETEYGHQQELTALKANWTPSPDDKEWPRFKLWRGLLSENVTQAFCAGLLRHSITKLEDIVLHCHDELALECKTPDAEQRAKELQHVMETPPPWAVGLPLKAEPKIMTRYGK